MTTTTHLTFSCPHCEHKVEVFDVGDGEVITCTNEVCRRQFQADLPHAQPERELILPPDVVEDREQPGEVAAVTNQQPHEAPVATTTTQEPPAPVEHTGPESILAPQPEVTGTHVHAPEQPQILAVYHPPMFSRHPLRFLFNVALAALGLAILILGLIRGEWFAGIVGLGFLGVGLGRQLLWWWEAQQTTLTVTTRGLVITEGLFRTTTKEIHHNTISGLHIFQTNLNKLLHSGAILTTYGPENEEVYIDSIQNPHRVAEQIRELAKK
jgi:hypothetical protein